MSNSTKKFFCEEELLFQNFCIYIAIDLININYDKNLAEEEINRLKNFLNYISKSIEDFKVEQFSHVYLESNLIKIKNKLKEIFQLDISKQIFLEFLGGVSSNLSSELKKKINIYKSHNVKNNFKILYNICDEMLKNYSDYSQNIESNNQFYSNIFGDVGSKTDGELNELKEKKKIIIQLEENLKNKKIEIGNLKLNNEKLKNEKNDINSKLNDLYKKIEILNFRFDEKNEEINNLKENIKIINSELKKKDKEIHDLKENDKKIYEELKEKDKEIHDLKEKNEWLDIELDNIFTFIIEKNEI